MLHICHYRTEWTDVQTGDLAFLLFASATDREPIMYNNQRPFYFYPCSKHVCYFVFL